MGFSDFKSPSMDEIKPLRPNEFLQRTLEFELTHQPSTIAEYGLCESLIYPLLREVWMRHSQLQLWSHIPLNVDETLNGTPDYLVTPRSAQGTDTFEPPLLTVSEAKRDDFVSGWGQSLAGMVGAQLLNRPHTHPVYGIVTTGQIWQFGRLFDRDVTIHPFKFTLVQLDLLLGVLDWLFQASQPNGS